jgi:N1221-like protein
MAHLNLVPPAPFPQPLASDVDDIPAVIVDEADLPAEADSAGDDRKVEPLASHPQGVDVGEAARNNGDNKSTFNVNEDGLIRDSLTLGELRKYVEGAAFKVKVFFLLGNRAELREKPRQYAFSYSDIESVKKEIEEYFAYKDNRSLQEGMRIFEESHPTRISPPKRQQY